MTEKLSTQEIEAIKAWDHPQFHDRLIALATQSGHEKSITAAMRKMGNQHAGDWFKPSDDNKQRSLADAKFQTVARFCMALEQLGISTSIDDLLTKSSPLKTMPDRVKDLEQHFYQTVSFRNEAEKLMNSFTAKNSEKLKDTLLAAADAIKHGKSTRQFGYVSGHEVRLICKHSSHVRAMTTRMDFGIEWNGMTGKPTPKHNEFDIMAKQLVDTRHTFIVPGGGMNETPCIPPSPFSDSFLFTWQERAEMFKDLFLQRTHLDPVYWNQNIIFRHTDLPIPASVAIFGLNKEGYEALQKDDKTLVEDLNEEGRRFIHPTSDGGAFVGIGIPGSDASKVSSLLNTRSLLFAANAFIQYWNHLPEEQQNTTHSSDPRDGLPTGLNTEYPQYPKYPK